MPGPSPAPLESRLQLKPGMRGAVVGAPDGFRLEGVTLAAEGGDLDFVLAFCPDAAAVAQRAPAAIARVKPDGLVWLAYPKAGQLKTDINRDRGWEPVTALGYRGVRQISLDATWSALRFREAVRIGR